MLMMNRYEKECVCASCSKKMRENRGFLITYAYESAEFYESYWNGRQVMLPKWRLYDSSHRSRDTPALRFFLGESARLAIPS